MSQGDLRNDPELAGLRELVDDQPALPDASRERAIRAALAADAAEPAEPRSSIQRFLFPTVAGAAAVAAIVLFVVTQSGEPSEPERIRAEPGQLVEVGGAEVRAVDGHAELRAPATGGIMLSDGRITVDVSPAAGEQFRVETPRFTAVVTGTRFTVDARRVEVHEGAVAIYAPTGELLEPEVEAGELWSLESGLQARAPERAEPEPEPEPKPEPAPEPEPAAEPAPSAGEAETAAPSPRTWLRRARKALARGDVAGARTAVDRALDGRPSRAQRAEAETLRAEASLVAGDRGDALARYRAVARRFRGTPAGENALFAAGRLAARTGDRAGAAELFRTYAEQYPKGRFAGEVEDWLARLSN